MTESVKDYLFRLRVYETLLLQKQGWRCRETNNFDWNSFPEKRAINTEVLWRHEDAGEYIPGEDPMINTDNESFAEATTDDEGMIYHWMHTPIQRRFEFPSEGPEEEESTEF